MNFKKIVIYAMASLLTFTVSCNTNDDDVEIVMPKGQYENGYLASNEGDFGKPNASVTYISRDLSVIENNIYSTNNSNENLGDVLQNISYNDDKAYLVLNNTNKIVVVNRYTFKKLSEITSNIVYPRYIAFAGNYMYVTNSGSEKYLSIYNKNDNSFVKKIGLNPVERVVEAGGNIFVQNASFGTGNRISYIKNNNLESTITIPNGQINKIISDGNNVYAIAAGNPDSYIYHISNTGSITKTITLTGISSANNLDLYSDNFYFTSKNKIYVLPKTANTGPSAPLITVKDNAWSTFYGFNVLDGKIFATDANGFTENSKIDVYSTSGTLIKTFTAGMGTNAIYAN